MTDQRQPDPAKDDGAFRTSVLVKLAEIGRDITYVKSSVDETKSALADHVRHDNDRFGAVNSDINSNKNGISKGTGILIGVIALLGLVMWLIDRLQP